MEKLATVEIVREGDVFIAKLQLEDGGTIRIEGDDFEELLEQIAIDLQDKFGIL